VSYAKRNKLIFNIILTGMSLIMVFPIAWWVGATFKPMKELASLSIFPANPTLNNYIDGWKMSSGFSFTHYYKNSLTIGLLIILGAVLTSGYVAFGYARVNFFLRNFWFSILMLTLMLPSQVTVVSQFILYNNLGFVDSYIPLILPSYLGGGAFFIFLLVQFIRTIPRELDEAATIDGANLFRIYWQVIFPLIKTPLVTVAIFAFIWSWDDFYSQILYISSVKNFTVGLALRMFIDQNEVQWCQLLAMALLSVIPSVLLFFFAQKEFVAGIATQGLKT